MYIFQPVLHLVVFLIVIIVQLIMNYCSKVAQILLNLELALSRSIEWQISRERNWDSPNSRNSVITLEYSPCSKHRCVLPKWQAALWYQR